jgi:hypothetical protein
MSAAAHSVSRFGHTPPAAIAPTQEHSVEALYGVLECHNITSKIELDHQNMRVEDLRIAIGLAIGLLQGSLEVLKG